MNAQEWIQRGLAEIAFKPGEAKECFDQALKLDQRLPGLVSLWLWTKLAVCDWVGLDEAFGRLREDIEAERLVYPYPLNLAPLTPKEQLKAVRAFTRGIQPQERPRPKRGWRTRIGYFGRDFYNHATMHLMAGMFEHHDRSKFEVTIFSSAPVFDLMTRRAQNSVERFVDVSKATDEEIAEKARALNLDIAVNLRGFDEGDALGPFALGLAPIQANYLVYPGTMGSECLDYLIADPTIVPFSHQEHYSEKIVYLPCYQVNDRQRPLFDPRPRDHLVFCCFNQTTKIVPLVFDTWMRLLREFPESVLWLFRSTDEAEVNLKAEAEARGVPADRLVFHAPVEVREHLERYREVSLFLDTPYYGAHTTASDALWNGVPVLTLQGETFASRVASSLLNTVGLPGLVTTTMEAYEAKALELASHRSQLRDLQAHLVSTRLKSPLFDTARTTRQLEAAYTMMLKRGQPESIWVT